jgi:hypothetical protein
MTTQEKVRLYRDARAAMGAVGRILDGGHNLDPIDHHLKDSCFAIMAGLAVTIARLEVEVGTDNL